MTRLGYVSRGGRRLLEVPFLPQTEDLCGGAALAMVLRYWGAAAVQPADFAPLVDRGVAGIPTNVLASACAHAAGSRCPSRRTLGLAMCGCATRWSAAGP